MFEDIHSHKTTIDALNRSRAELKTLTTHLQNIREIKASCQRWEVLMLSIHPGKSFRYPGPAERCFGIYQQNQQFQ
jgi:hypothetical protein